MIVETEILLIAGLVLLVGTTVQATIGFGANLLAVPVFAILDADLLPAPIFIATMVMAISTAARERHDIQWTVVRCVSTGRVPGTIVGALVLASVSVATMQILIGALILLAVGLTARGLALPTTRRVFTTAGIVSGFTATTASIGGPPVALTLHHLAGPALRSTMGATFSISVVITLTGIAAAGRLGFDELLVGLALMPGAIIGFLISGPMRAHVNESQLRNAVLVLATSAALVALARGVF
jgi:uncharacterized membrane protein YfcA